MVGGKKWRPLLLTLVLVFFVWLYSQSSLDAGLEKADKRLLTSGVRKWYTYKEDDLNGPSISMSDPRLVKKLKDYFLIPPPPYSPSHKYKLSEPNLEDTSMGQGEKIRAILGPKKNGIFIESGALDGETRSNSLYFERFLNWTGLLIEPDPLNFAMMLEKNRRAWLSPSCISPSSYPEIISLKQENNKSKLSKNTTGLNLVDYIDVQCFPFYTYLLALNITHIDYFSLDIEGLELDVLETIPFDKVDISTLSVEFIHISDGKKALKDFMESKGYKVHSKVTHQSWLANDYIFFKT